jgi:protein involved in polysaccharide export with SLBB domain
MNHLITDSASRPENASVKEITVGHQIKPVLFKLMAVVFSGILAACQTPPPPAPTVAQVDRPQQPEVLTIKEGDVLKIAFPGAPSLDTIQQVRRDGRITLPTGEEIVAAGNTSADLEQSLIKRYASQLVSKEVVVTVTASSFEVYVSGMVLHPGKIQSDHPLSALEAIMEAGGFDNEKADIQKVEVIRNDGGKTKNYVVNLKLVLEGKQNEPFYLKPSDIVYVPEKFSWF